jgi:hypothetical protein
VVGAAQEINMEVTVEITSYCPNNCDYCSTNATDNGRHISYAEVEGFLQRVENIDRINISGGEPLAHPEFYDILQLCKSYTKNVWVYTNALDKIIYNSDVVKEIEVHANVCLVPGRRVYLPKNADQVHLLKLIPQGRAVDMDAGNFSVSGNLKGCDACDSCDHILLQADGKIMQAPCKKKYD